MLSLVIDESPSPTASPPHRRLGRVLRGRLGSADLGAATNEYDEAARRVEIGWTFLARDYWGGTYNREMKRLMLEHAFRFVDRVFFNVGATNYRSQRAMEKIGGVRSGTTVNSLGVESLVYVIDAIRFAARAPDCNAPSM